jgi:thiosulfate/3-mercaptopyruvate sulfurtransferase
MTFKTLITTSDLARHIDDPDWVIVDSRFKLADPAQGRLGYKQAHIPGAVYAHLDDDLSGPIIKGATGRHPMPGVEAVSKVFSRLGIDSSVQVVAYDDIGGALAAGRVWWLLRWLGHEAVALLDGGWQMWLKSSLPVRGGVEQNSSRRFVPVPRNELIVTSEEVDAMRNDPHYRLLDARSADRFRGENETIDPVAGHIPGAVSAPYVDNMNEDLTFRDRTSLRKYYERLVGDLPGSHVVCYCGSGVTATHDIIAMVEAGFDEPRLYPGSYSEWITDPKRPVQK